MSISDKLSQVLKDLEEKQREYVRIRAAEAKQLEQERLRKEKIEKEKQLQLQLAQEKAEKERKKKEEAEQAAEAARIEKEEAERKSREKEKESAKDGDGTAATSILGFNNCVVSKTAEVKTDVATIDLASSSDLPLDVKQAMSSVKILDKLVECGEYKSFTESNEPQMKQIRTEIFMRTGSVRNGVSGTLSQLSMVSLSRLTCLPNAFM